MSAREVPRPSAHPRPVRIDEVAPDAMTIAWNDGVVTHYRYHDLRFACRCAVCREELTGREIIRREQIAADIRPLGIVPVGNYALRFRWSDGHDLGFYSYQMLRELGEKEGRGEPDEDNQQ